MISIQKYLNDKHKECRVAESVKMLLKAKFVQEFHLLDRLDRKSSYLTAQFQTTSSMGWKGTFDTVKPILRIVK